jgi:hypothetical protein
MSRKRIYFDKKLSEWKSYIYKLICSSEDESFHPPTPSSPYLFLVWSWSYYLHMYGFVVFGMKRWKNWHGTFTSTILFLIYLLIRTFRNIIMIHTCICKWKTVNRLLQTLLQKTRRIILKSLTWLFFLANFFSDSRTRIRNFTI